MRNMTMLLAVLLALTLALEASAMKRYYVCDVIEEQTEEGRRYYPAVEDHGVNYVADIKVNPTTGLLESPWCLVMVSGNNHERIIADPRCVPMPDFPLDGKVNAMHNATKSQMETRLAARGILLNLAAADGYRDVIRGLGRLLNPRFDENNFDISE